MKKSKSVSGASEVVSAHVRAELAQTIEDAKHENVTLIHYNSDTGEAWCVTPAGEIEPYEVGPDQSDWARNAAMTDEEIEAAIASDPDEAYLDDDELGHVEIVRHPNGKQSNGA